MAIDHWKDPSLPAFHAGQLLARDGDLPGALLRFEEALRISKGNLAECGPEYNDWIAYVEATIAYLRGDLDGLQSKIPAISWNTEVVNRLRDGLSRFGNPDYARDFGA